MEGTGKYRLPSEAEWEYAACAGATTRYSYGNDKSDLGEYAWYWDNSDRKANLVGQKQPNPWGLYDMHGNKWIQKAENDLRTAEIVLSTENPSI